MARARIHQDDDVLDAARDLFLDGGTAAVTTAAVSARCGAPTGSLYHRFGSRQGLLVELWLRTVRRFQAGLLDACAAADPGVTRAVAAAEWVLVFAHEQTDDARLLLQCRREELLGSPGLSDRQTDALVSMNEPITRLVRRLSREVFGSAVASAVEAINLAVVDLPYAAVRRHLRAGTDPYRHRTQILAGVRTLLTKGRES